MLGVRDAHRAAEVTTHDSPSLHIQRVTRIARSRAWTNRTLARNIVWGYPYQRIHEFLARGRVYTRSRIVHSESADLVISGRNREPAATFGPREWGEKRARFERANQTRNPSHAPDPRNPPRPPSCPGGVRSFVLFLPSVLHDRYLPHKTNTALPLALALHPLSRSTHRRNSG